jgi:two-component system OmpR family response regulator
MGTGKKILIVDDDVRITDLLADFCVDGGYQVRMVNDSRQAVATARDWKPDLITLDLEMPDMDGIDVLRSLRSDPATRAVPVIIISVVAREAALLKESVQGLFSKPIRFHSLLAQIQTLIDRPAA